MFKRLREGYTARSKIVHGDTKAASLLTDDLLRDTIVSLRTLILTMIDGNYDVTKWEKRLRLAVFG
jgi:hypothetical protein